jgi:hypothetical protein
MTDLTRERFDKLLDDLDIPSDLKDSLWKTRDSDMDEEKLIRWLPTITYILENIYFGDDDTRSPAEHLVNLLKIAK